MKKRGGTPLSLLCKHMTHHRILRSGLRACREKELRLVMPCSRACAYRTGGDLTSTFILKVSPRGLCNPNQVQPNHENPIFFHEPFLDLAFSNSLSCIFMDSNDICCWLSYFKQLKICFSLKKGSKYLKLHSYLLLQKDLLLQNNILSTCIAHISLYRRP